LEDPAAGAAGQGTPAAGAAGQGTPDALDAAAAVYTAVGNWLLHAGRALNGLDEPLHAGPKSYILLGNGETYIPLSEYVIPIALAHAPVVFILLGLGWGGGRQSSPSIWDVARGGLVWMISCLIVGGIPYAALFHPFLQEKMHAYVRWGMGFLTPEFFFHGVYPNVSPSASEATCSLPQELVWRHMSWLFFTVGLELGWGGILSLLSSREITTEMAAATTIENSIPIKFLGGGKGVNVTPLPSYLPPTLSFSLFLQGACFLPLVYFDAPLLWLESMLVMSLLIGTTCMLFVLNKDTWVRRVATQTLWIVFSPAHALLIFVVWERSGQSCVLAEIVERASTLHSTFGCLHVVLLLFLLLPMHVSIAFR